MKEIDLKVGDLVTAYWKGYYEITGFTRRRKDKTKEGDYWQIAYALTE